MLFNWFGKKKIVEIEQAPPCFHVYGLVDVGIHERYNGIDIDIENSYSLACVKCNKRRTVSEYDYYVLNRKGLIQEVRATK
ncbi:hypothetical protein CN399_08680 [Bacillus cereus]|uniref:hypothetical protein n=1 Tax=Bacillus cereus TaxID=1396 RepID=UPI000BF502CE|nr:hypothetical protein [Bacillus cereus]PFB17021.1 hypothetical protein CN399_08680 [Bacillus cereus]